VKRRESEHSRARARGTRGRSSRRESPEDKVLVKSMIALASDMHSIKDRVSALAQAAQQDKQVAHAQRTNKIDMAHPAGSYTQDLSSEVSEMRKELHKYKQEARADKQELRFEQSVPSNPVYQYHEPDHTTPLFGNGGKDCGTLCKLKELVKKTRKNISKELDAALEH